MAEKAKKKAWWQKLIIALAIAAIVVAVFFGAVIGYFKIPVSGYYKASEKAFEIPGLSDGFIAQGISYDDREDTFFITGYMKDKSASPVYLVKRSEGKKAKAKTLYLKKQDGSDYTGHCGGLTVRGDYIYVAGGGKHCLYVYSYAEAVAAEDRSPLVCKGEFKIETEDQSDYLGVAFVTVWDNELVAGEFYREQNYPTPDAHKRVTKSGETNTAMAVSFAFADGTEGEGETAFGLKKQPSKAISMPGLVQGAYFENGKAVLSTSYGVAFSHLYEYDLEKAATGETAKLLGKDLPLYSLDHSSLEKDYKIAPMSEEIVLAGGKTYVMCESASNKYIFGKFTGAKWCYATDLAEIK